MAFLHAQKIQHPHLVALMLKKKACIAEQLALWIKHHKRSVRLTEIGLCVEPCLARAASAHHDGVQIAQMLPAVQAHADVLRKELVSRRLLCPVFPADGSGIAPLCRAVFLTAPIVPAGGEVDAEEKSIYEQQKKDSLQTVLT